MCGENSESMLKQVVYIATTVLYSVKSDDYIEVLDEEPEVHP